MRAFYAPALVASIVGLCVAACGADDPPPPAYPTAPVVTQTTPPVQPTQTAPNIMGIPIPSGLALPSGMPSTLPIPSGLPGFPTSAPAQ